MKIYLNDNEKYFLLLITFGIIAAFIYGYCKPYQKYTFEKQEAYANVIFQDIAYKKRFDFSGELMFMDSDGSNPTAADVFIPMGGEISILGEKLYEIGKDYHNDFITFDWSPDGKTLGVVLSKGTGYEYVPALINEGNELFTCMDDPYFESIRSIVHIEVLDDERIMINRKNYLSIYNIVTCREESKYFESERIEEFSISSKNWLAVNEEVDDDLMLNVYDEHGKIVFSNNEGNRYIFITWSNDGNKLFYYIDGMKTPFIHNFETGETIEIDTYLIYPSFLPDGEKMISGTSSSDIIIIDINTMEKTVIGQGAEPHWRPDGSETYIN